MADCGLMESLPTQLTAEREHVELWDFVETGRFIGNLVFSLRAHTRLSKKLTPDLIFFSLNYCFSLYRCLFPKPAYTL